MTFGAWTLEHVLDAADAAEAGPWATEVRERYCGKGSRMKTEVRGKTVTTTLTRADREKLIRLLTRLGPHAHVERLGRRLSSDELWYALVSQVCVMGSARGMERINGDLAKKDRFARATSLRAWSKNDLDPSYMSSTLGEFSATRFAQRAARQLLEIATNPKAVRRTRVVLLDGLPRARDPNVIRDELLDRCPTFKRKSVSDYMITSGLSHDVIALDVRVIGALKKYVGYTTPVGRVQSSKSIYLSVEQALREVCKEAGCRLARLDRTLFQFTSMSALKYVMEIEP